MQDAFKGYVRADVVQDMFEMLRLDYRDEAQAFHESWKELDRQLIDALTFKQFKQVNVLSMYAARYKYIRKISRSKKLQNLAWLAERALVLKLESAAKYRAHLELDPELIAQAKVGAK